MITCSPKEMYILHEALIDNSNLDNPIQESEFASNDGFEIYECMVAIHNSGESVDFINLVEALFDKDLGHLAIIVYELM